MNEVCIESCAPKRDASGFCLRQGLNLPDMPHFPLREWNEEMKPAERQVCAGVYLAKVTDHLQGVRREPPSIRVRTNPYRYRNDAISQNIPLQELLDSVQEGDSLDNNQKVSEGETDRHDEADREATTIK